MLVLNTLLGIGLLLVAYQYYFYTGWDAAVVISEAEKIARGDYENIGNWYFSRCTNNVFLTVLYSIIIRVGNIIGIGNSYFYLVAFQCVGWAYVGYLVYLIGYKLSGDRKNALFSWLLYMIFVGMSPWVVVPYADTMGMIYVATLSYMILCRRHFFLMGILLSTGYFIKPQILILGISGVVLYGFDVLRKIKIKKERRELTLFIIGLGVGLLIVYSGQRISSIQIDKEKSLRVSHYVMLGLNDRTNGVFAGEDLIFSESFESAKERKEANWKVAKERIKGKGVGGMVIHLGKKLLTVYNDGSFAWGAEGSFFSEMLFSGHPRVREFFREIYIPGGKWYAVFLDIMQSVWMGTLFFASFVFSTKPHEKVIKVFALGLIGFTVFELLLEPRARHVLNYLPIWIPFASLGMEKICHIGYGCTKKRGIK